VNGWQFGGIFVAQSGTPFTALVAGDPAGSLMQSHAFQRPVFNDIPGCSTNAVNPGDINNYIKTQCLLPPDANIIRNSIGRNTLMGPREVSLDFSIFKNFPVKKISESFRAQFRVEAFNVLNHPNFQPPYNNNVVFDGSTPGSPNFNPNPIAGAGLLTSTQTTARQIQIGLKLIW
jgi:hypothetical protein